MNITYPELERIELLYPGPQILLGRDIYWTEKRDGSQLRVWLEDGSVHLATRHQEASGQFAEAFWATPQARGVEELLRAHSGEAESWASDFNFQPVVFGELLLRGKSPACFEVHDEDEFIIFDIFNRKSETFLSYTALYQTCYHFGVSAVAAWGLTRHATMEDLLAAKNLMLEKARIEQREGVVLKAYGDIFIVAKEKLDTPEISYVNRDMATPVLPLLAESELFGAIAKAHADLGDDFRDKAKAMPLIARYVVEEQEKHLCGRPAMKLFDAYRRYVVDRA